MKLWPFHRKQKPKQPLPEIEDVKRRQQRVELQLRAVQLTMERRGRK